MPITVQWFGIFVAQPNDAAFHGVDGQMNGSLKIITFQFITISGNLRHDI